MRIHLFLVFASFAVLVYGCGKQVHEDDPCNPDTYDSSKCETSTSNTEASPIPVKTNEEDQTAGTVVLKAGNDNGSPFKGCTHGTSFWDGNTNGLGTVAIYFDTESKVDSSEFVEVKYWRDGEDPVNVVVRRSERLAFIEGLKPDSAKNYNFECTAQNSSANPTASQVGAQSGWVLYTKPAEPQYFGCTFAKFDPSEDIPTPGGLVVHFQYPKTATEVNVMRDGVKIATSYGETAVLDRNTNSEKTYTCSAVIDGKEVMGINSVKADK